MKIAVILPAAGLGKRFGASAGNTSGGGASGGGSKIELDLLGRPVFQRALELFVHRAEVVQTILAVNPDSLDEFRFRWGEKLSFLGVTLAAGGKVERWETVLKALALVKPEATHVAVHDAARPLSSARLIDRVWEAAAQHPAVIPGLPVAATLKKTAVVETPAGDALDALLGPAGKTITELRQVVGGVDRRDLVEVQTPQVFAVGLLRQAYAQITDGKLDGRGITDDAGLVEHLGQPVMVVEGEATNFKITRPLDLELARAWLAATEQKTQATTARKRLFNDEDD